MPPTCPHCAKPVHPNAKFCGYCGAPLQPAPPVAQPSTPARPSNPAPRPQAKTNRSVPTWLIVLGVCAAALSCLVILLVLLFRFAEPFLTPPTPTPTEVPTSTPTVPPLDPTTGAGYVGPYADGLRPLRPDLVIGQPGDLDAPRGIAASPDGSIFFTDSDHHRVVHLAADGSVIASWGSKADVAVDNAPGGTFNTPWGIAVGPDGYVYVADTWNHRIQKFTPQGEFVAMFGTFGSDGAPTSLYGPRDIKFDSYGRMFVSDTGNKRILVFTPDGDFITQIGASGAARGEFDEPCGLVVDRNNILFVADTWNRRVQTFVNNPGSSGFSSLLAWNVEAWGSGNSNNNEPYLATAPDGSLLMTDPEAGMILQFSPSGAYVRGWSNNNPDNGYYSIFNGIAVDPSGNAWVTDAANDQVLRFSLR